MIQTLRTHQEEAINGGWMSSDRGEGQMRAIAATPEHHPLVAQRAMDICDVVGLSREFAAVGLPPLTFPPRGAVPVVQRTRRGPMITSRKFNPMFIRR